MNNVNILVEAKKEYTNELQKILKPRIYEGFKSIYEDIINVMSKELEENRTQSSSLIKTFQKMLKEIPQWNQDVIKTEYARIEKLSNCDYFDNLIEAVFITNTKILTSVQINDNKSLNIKINIPQPSYFIHKCYMECAKEIYKNPYLFDQKNLNPKERHNNLRETLDIIDNSINNTIRNLLPIRDILKQGLTKNNENKNEKYSDTEEEYVKKNKIKEDKYVSDEDSVKDNEDINDDVSSLEDVNDEEDISKHEDMNSNIINEEDLNDNVNGNVINEKDVNEDVNNDVNNDVNDDVNNEEDMNDDVNDDVNNEEDLNDDVNNAMNSENEDNIVIKDDNDKEVINTNQTKEIIYNKSIPPFVKKIKNIEKIDNIVLSEKDSSIDKKLPFIKKIKNKYLKNKNVDKNISFYKKKYEENSANYNSISDNTKITVEKEPIMKDKIIKNKIMLDINSSDEENSVNEIDL